MMQPVDAQKTCSTSSERNGSGIAGLVVNIQHFTIHDGPGIRTEIFLKGCPLKCKWCSNPESIRPTPEVGVYASRCIGIDKCGYCLKACPKCDQGAFYRQNNVVAGIDRDICHNCLQCAEACPSDALVVWGRKMSIADVMAEVMDDVSFYEKSGGGVTISGGDPLVQWRFSREILKQCKGQHIHTCLETEMHCNASILEELYPYTDLVITDIKHMDPQRHRQLTGVDNGLILRNIKKTVAAGKPVIIRIPVIPGYNDCEENIRATAEFISTYLANNISLLQMLPYRPLGLEKYDALGLVYPMAEMPPPDVDAQKATIDNLVQLMASYGVPAVAGSTQTSPKSNQDGCRDLLSP